MSLPNQLTLLRILLTPIFVLLLFLDSATPQISSFAVFTIASLTDWYDGYTARKFGNITMWGRFLDPLADKVLISSGFICFSILGYVKAWMVLIIVARDFLITGLRSYAVMKGKPIATNLFAKAKTFSQFSVIYFIFIYHLCMWKRPGYVIKSVLWKIEEMRLILFFMIIVVMLTVISGFVYIVENRVQLRQMAFDIYRIIIPSVL